MRTVSTNSLLGLLVDAKRVAVVAEVVVTTPGGSVETLTFTSIRSDELDPAWPTGTVIAGALARADVAGQRLDPTRYATTIGGLTLDLVDLDASVIAAFAQQNALGREISKGFVTLYVGYDFLERGTFDPDDFDVWAVQRLTAIQVDGSRATLQTQDVQREARKTIFARAKTRLFSTLSATATTIECESLLDDFGSTVHGPWYEDRPNFATVGYVKIGDEIIRWEAKGTPALGRQTFTACTRGVFGTRAQAHEVRAGQEPPVVEEFVYLEGSAVSVARALLTGAADSAGTYTIPDSWHAGLDVSDVSSEWGSIGADIWSETDPAVGPQVRVWGVDATDAKGFLERELFPIAGVFAPVLGDGALGLRRLTSVVFDAPSVLALTDSDLIRTGPLRYVPKNVRNRYRIEWSVDASGNIRRVNEFLDSDAVARYGDRPLLTVRLPALHGSSSTRASLVAVKNSLRERLAEAPMQLEVTATKRAMLLEVGDVVRVSSSLIRDPLGPYAGRRVFDTAWAFGNGLGGTAAIPALDGASALTISSAGYTREPAPGSFSYGSLGLPDFVARAAVRADFDASSITWPSSGGMHVRVVGRFPLAGTLNVSIGDGSGTRLFLNKAASSSSLLVRGYTSAGVIAVSATVTLPTTAPTLVDAFLYDDSSNTANSYVCDVFVDGALTSAASTTQTWDPSDLSNLADGVVDGTFRSGSEISLVGVAVRSDVTAASVAGLHDAARAALASSGGSEIPTLDRSFEVESVALDLIRQRARLDLATVSRRPGPISDCAEDAALSDGFYNATGTDLDSLAGVSGGVVTSDVTLTGGTDLSSSVWYHLGDLEVAAGVTVTIEDNVQLRIRGTLTVNGAIDGVGTGLDAPTDTGPDNTFNPAPLNRPAQAFLPGPTATAGFLGRVQGGAGLAVNDSGVFFGSAREVSVPAPIGGSSRTGVPEFRLVNNGTTLEGVPTDLRGSSGAPGGREFNDELDGATPGYRQWIGGAGGAGGAGLLIVARGMVVGLGGLIDLSGSAGLAGPRAATGGGAGGAPGALVVLLDGDLAVVPTFTAQNFVAAQGTNADDRPVAEQDLSATAFRVQFIPCNETTTPDPSPFPVPFFLDEVLDGEPSTPPGGAIYEATHVTVSGNIDVEIAYSHKGPAPATAEQADVELDVERKRSEDPASSYALVGAFNETSPGYSRTIAAGGAQVDALSVRVRSRGLAPGSYDFRLTARYFETVDPAPREEASHESATLVAESLER